MKRLLMLGLVLAALATYEVSVKAGWRGHRHQPRNINSASEISRQIRNHYLSRSHYFGYRDCHRPRVHATWHQTDHVDHHFDAYVPHGYQPDFIPGHWDRYRTGHWNTHHH